MATALISALTNKAVRSDVAMTGEITLRGRVLPIGGLKEKTLGAMRAGIRTVIIPEKNKKELSELPRHLRRKIEFVPVRQMSVVCGVSEQLGYFRVVSESVVHSCVDLFSSWFVVYVDS